MAKIRQSIEMARRVTNKVGTANTYIEAPEIATRLDSSVFNGTVTYYFEASLLNNGTNGTQTAYVELYNHTDSISISGSELSTTRNNGLTQRLRSNAITLTGDKIYTVRLKHSASTQNSFLYSARIIVMQTGNITKTQIHHELGDEMSTSSTSNANRLAGAMKFLYQSAKYDGSVTVRHDAVLIATSGNTTTSGMYDETASSLVTSSEVSTTATSYTYMSGSNITLTDGHIYRPTSYVSAGASVTFHVNKLVFTITNFTKFLAYICVHNPLSTSTTSTSFDYWGDYQNGFNNLDFLGCHVNYYFEALLTISNAAQTVSALLTTIDNVNLDASDVTGTLVTHTGDTVDTRVRSSVFVPAVGDLNLEAALQASGGATATVPNCYVIAEVNNIGKTDEFMATF